MKQSIFLCTLLALVLVESAEGAKKTKQLQIEKEVLYIALYCIWLVVTVDV